MEQTRIITFANQKGGVGKTTLCALFASYLVGKGHQVAVFDTDPQQSIVKKRASDSAAYAGIPLPYSVKFNREVRRILIEKCAGS